MRGYFIVILIAIVALAFVSCEESSSPDSNSAWITQIENGFVWGDSVNIALGFSGDTPESVVFFIDNVGQPTDLEAPFEFGWNMQEIEFGKHFVQAKVIYPDGGVFETPEYSIRFMPFTFEARLLSDFDGYTRRDESGNLIGDVDTRDWQLWEPFAAPTREVVFGGVELCSQGRKVYIDWDTRYEYENQGFFLHRGLDANAWISHRTIQLTPYLITGTAGNDTTVEYSYVDSLNIEYLTYYYWLEAIDQQSESDVFGPYSCTVSEEVEWETKMNSVYPNPVESEAECNFTLELPSRVSAIVVDEEGDILSLILLDVALPPGENSFTWNCESTDYGFYRCVYHIENADTELIGYGDIVHGIGD